MTDRHARQRRFAGIGDAGQARLARARVAVIGVGALGTHVAQTLARAGVGTLWLFDRDVVELHNLHRQVLFGEADVGRSKAEVAAAALLAADASLTIRAHAAEFTATLWDELCAADGRPDVIVDGTANFPTRGRINDLAVRDEVPWVHGAATGANGQAFVVLPGTTPCLRCFLPAPPPAAEIGNCETHGIVAPVVATVAAFQSAQVLKLLTGAAVARGVFVVDVWNDRYEMRLRDALPDPECDSCGTGRLPSLTATPSRTQALCGRAAVQVLPQSAARLDLAGVARRLAGSAADVTDRAGMLQFAADGCRFSLFRDGRAIIAGTTDELRAAALYDRWIGA